MKIVFHYLMILTFIFSPLALFAQQIETNQNLQKPDNTNRLDQLMADQNEPSLQILAINASQFGIRYPETFILMQNRMGVRIEYCVDRSRLQLWISPQAGKSLSYRDRNWSNRDDHTDIFNRILLPGLNFNDFLKCDWDPFHSIIYYKNQTVHLAQVYDQPAVLIWFEKKGIVDFKSTSADQPLERTEKKFMITHTDRQRTFEYAAIIGPDDGIFQQQVETDTGRSIYARAHLTPGQFLVISGELSGENIDARAEKISQTSIQEILNQNEHQITRDLERGQFKLKNNPDMQKLLDKSRRVALSMQDFKGFMRSTNQYIYYLLWYRDGGMNTGHITYTGWVNPVKDHVKFALLNPNTSVYEPKGKFFGQVMGGPITKWQEDGLFYVLWPAFTYWTQTGDDTFCQGDYLKTMEEAMDWLEHYCYDKEKGLFGRYHFCETPLTNSHGDGWDKATGAPTFKFESKYKEKTIIRSYDIYVNLLNYSCYVMLSMMETGSKAEEYLAKAKLLEKNLLKFYDHPDILPAYGDLLTIDNQIMTGDPYGMDRTDFQWAFSLPFFYPNLPEKYKKIHDQLLSDLMTKPYNNFLCSYLAILTAMDTEIHDEERLMQAMNYLVPQSIRPGKYLPMPYAVPEIVDMEDGDPFHDVRPLVYSIAPWLSAVTNLGLRRLPMGIAVRATQNLESIDNYEYKAALIDIIYKGSGKINKIILNQQPIPHSYQIPENMLLKGDNRLVVEMKGNAVAKDILIASTVKLNKIEQKGSKIYFEIEAFGKNILTFKRLTRLVTIMSSNSEQVNFNSQKMDNLDYISFEGRGKFRVILDCKQK
ncbi:hypothetical protein JW964_00135 [candidate division KSB1 bacterium]|nr:hypothetical protein [candidate division KSB1 bacterium]